MKKVILAVMATMVMVSSGTAAESLLEQTNKILNDPNSPQIKDFGLRSYVKSRGEIMEGRYGSLSQNVHSLQTISGTLNINYSWSTLLYKIETIKIPDSIIFYSLMQASDAEPLIVFNKMAEGKKISPQQRVLLRDILTKFHDNVFESLVAKDTNYESSTMLFEAIVDLGRWDVVANLIAFYENPNGYKNAFKKKHPEYVKIFGFETEREGRHHNGYDL